MNLSPGHATPVRSPQPKSSTKVLQLTPIWEEVVKNNRLPPGVDQDLIFREISVRLEDLEWPVRQHAFRVLSDIIPILSGDLLDERIVQNDIFSKLIINLGHPAPGIRKVASDTLRNYFKQTARFGKTLEDFLQYGVMELNLVNNDRAGILRENITLGTMACLADVLKPLIAIENGDHPSVEDASLAKIVSTLAGQVRIPQYREGCLETLWKLVEIVGSERFHRTLENVPDRDLILDLMDDLDGKDKDPFLNDSKGTYEEINWTDETKSDNSSEGISRGSFGLDYPEPEVKAERQKESSYIVSNESSEDFTDGTDTDTYTKEPVPNDLVGGQDLEPEFARFVPPRFVPVLPLDSEEKSSRETEIKSQASSCPRIVLETEIELAEDEALSMRVMEQEEEEEGEEEDPRSLAISPTEKRFITEDGNLILKVLPDQEEIDLEDKIKTPRRVHFGGEVIKLRTPDSDTTDITIEIREAEKSEEAEEAKESGGKKVEEKKPEMVSSAKVVPSSQIPLPVSLASGSSFGNSTLHNRRNVFPLKSNENQAWKGKKNPGRDEEEEDSSSKNSEESAPPSSSGSETEMKRKWEEDPETNFWNWTKLRLVDDDVIKDLKMKDDWKIQYPALEQVKLVLIDPKIIDRLEKSSGEKGLLNSLFNCLLHKLPESNSPQVTYTALTIVSRLVETLPKDVLLVHVEHLVRGLCRFVGGTRSVNLKMESVQCLKRLFAISNPSVMDVLLGEGCLFSSTSKLRENSLLAIVYLMMTFPSDCFDVDKIVEKVTDSAADPRRRVRHAALEAISVVSQFSPPETMAKKMARTADKVISTARARMDFVSAIQFRLSRRSLPSISTEGLVLYALQIPVSRRFGNPGNPMGADVDWILSGTGSLSTGSAKSKSQLNAAQRIEIGPGISSVSPDKWNPPMGMSRRKSSYGDSETPTENPWTAQKKKNESSEMRETMQEGRRNRGGGTGREMKQDNAKPDRKKIMRPEDVTWALVPLTGIEDSILGRDKTNDIWGDSIIENIPIAQLTKFGNGQLRPLYLKFQRNREDSRLSYDDLDRFHRSQEGEKDSDGSEMGEEEMRLLTPTILRDLKISDGRKVIRGSAENPTRIPVLMNNQKNLRQNKLRSTTASGSGVGKIAETEDEYLTGPKAPESKKTGNGFSATFLPSIRSETERQKSSRRNEAGDVDGGKYQERMTQLSGFASNSREGKKKESTVENIRSHPSRGTPIVGGGVESEIFVGGRRMMDRRLTKSHEILPTAVASAPAVVKTEAEDLTSSGNTDFVGSLTGSELRRLTNGSEISGRIPYRNYKHCNPERRAKRSTASKSANKMGISSSPFPENLKPFDRPKECLDTCLHQLESQQWEVNMLALTSLLRLLKHHPAILLGQVHSIVVALARQIRNLRSQVTRAACQVSAALFLALKRNVEPDLDELAGPLFHRSADTNRFIRADCNDALDKMVDSVGHAKGVAVIISKGTTHQNATVRTVAARLLLRLSERVGPEKMLSLPKEIRDRMLQAGANLLTEGKLETRAFAKQVFRIWSSHPSFSGLLLEAISPNVLRQINKTLISIKS